MALRARELGPCTLVQTWEPGPCLGTEASGRGSERTQGPGADLGRQCEVPGHAGGTGAMDG